MGKDERDDPRPRMKNVGFYWVTFGAAPRGVPCLWARLKDAREHRTPEERIYRVLIERSREIPTRAR